MKITEAQKQSAINNILKIAEQNKRDAWAHIINVTEKSGNVHQVIINGHVMVRFNDNITINSTKYSTVHADMNDENCIYSERVVSDTGSMKDWLGRFGSDFIDSTSVIPSFESMNELCKRSNQKGKFIKENCIAEEVLPLLFKDSAGITHMFNMEYVVDVLKVICLNDNPQYNIFVDSSPIGVMMIHGELGVGVIMPMRYTDYSFNSLEKYQKLSQWYDRFAEIQQKITNSVRSILTDRENPLVVYNADVSVNREITILYNDVLFKNTVQFYLQKMMNPNYIYRNGIKLIDLELNLDNIVHDLKDAYVVVFNIFYDNATNSVSKEYEEKIKRSFVTYLIRYAKQDWNQLIFLSTGSLSKLFDKYLERAA